MNNNDILQRFLFDNAPVRGELVHLHASFQTIMHQHQYPSVIRTILGELLVAASLLCASIKSKGRLSVQFQGEGKLRLLLAQCTDQLELRGLAKWEGELDEDELIDEFKQGQMVITIDSMEAPNKRYQGIVEWHGESLSESIEAYFRHSEQLPTRLHFAVDKDSAAGLLIQILPKETEDASDLDWERISCLTATVTSAELLHLDSAVLLQKLYSEDEVRLFEPVPVAFRCTCSYERGENALLMLGQEEVFEELAAKQKIDVTCDFCNRVFEFDRAAIEALFKRNNGSDFPTQVH